MYTINCGAVIPAFVLFVSLSASYVVGQTGGRYSLRWHTVDAGGLTWATGGSYRVGGTIGQPDAGKLTGGAYTVRGGFWVKDIACSGSTAPVAELIGPDVSTKNRFLSFTAGDATRSQAVRVTFVSLPPPFDVWDGAQLWVGEPSEVSENGAIVDPNDPDVPPGTPTFQAAMLECTPTPHCRDWSTVGVVHVFHEGIVPSTLASSTGPIEIPAVYDVQVVDCLCNLAEEARYSDALTMTTAGSGDTVTDLTTTPPGPPDEIVSITDATAIIGRFVSDPNSIGKARADLEPNCLDLRINITDVLASVIGFQGLMYPYEPKAADPCDSPCANPLP